MWQAALGLLVLQVPAGSESALEGCSQQNHSTITLWYCVVSRCQPPLRSFSVTAHTAVWMAQLCTSHKSVFKAVKLSDIPTLACVVSSRKLKVGLWLMLLSGVLKLRICLQELQAGTNSCEFRWRSLLSVCHWWTQQSPFKTAALADSGCPTESEGDAAAAAAVSGQSEAASIFPALPNDLLITNMQDCQYFQRVLRCMTENSLATWVVDYCASMQNVECM